MSLFEHYSDGRVFIEGVEIPEEIIFEKHPDYPPLPSGAIKRYSREADFAYTTDGVDEIIDESIDFRRLAVFLRKKEQYRETRLIKYPLLYQDADISNAKTNKRRMDTLKNLEKSPELWFIDWRLEMLAEDGYIYEPSPWVDLSNNADVFVDKKRWLREEIGPMKDSHIHRFFSKREESRPRSKQ